MPTREELDRRGSPRIPLLGPVRVGPPRADVEAVVSASDLSRLGLFIDADRPVRLGARFSAEIALRSGARVYVPEAEVVYNRERPHSPGFGVRFTDPPDEVVSLIAEEIDRVLGEWSSGASEAATEIPGGTTEIRERTIGIRGAPEREPHVSSIELDVSEFPEPAFPSDFRWRDRIDEGWNEILGAGHEARRRLFDKVGRFPRLWTGFLAIACAVVVGAVGLELWTGTTAEAVELAPIDEMRGFAQDTQQVLMGSKNGLEAIHRASVSPAAPIVPNVQGTLTPKTELPPLVTEDDLLREPAPKPVITPNPATLSKLVVTRPEPSPARRVAQRATPVEKEKERAASTGLTMRVSQKARVLKTHVFRSPDRFVIDLADQDDQPVTTAARSGPKAVVRFGKHPGYVRVVIDGPSEILRGRVSKRGADLVVTLDYL